MHEKILEGLGLTRGEIAVYLSLLKLGKTTTGKIIDDSGLSGGKIYQILERLIKKGLVTYIVLEKTRYFQAETPRKLLELIEEKENNLQKQKSNLEHILPELTKIQKFHEEKYSAVIYKGFEGFKTALFDTLNSLSKEDEWLAFGVKPRNETIMRIWNKYHNLRAKKKIRSKILVANKAGQNWANSWKMSKCKILKLNSSAPMTVSKDIVMIYNWEELSIIKITNLEIANSFREFFECLWSISK